MVHSITLANSSPSPLAYVYKKDKENPGSYYAISKGSYSDSYIELNESEKAGYWGRYRIVRMAGREHGFGRLKEAKEELELRASLNKAHA